VLIVSLAPYFLDKGDFWFEENFKKILEARKTQAFFEDNILLIQRNQKYNFSQFLRKLDEMGYEKVYKISEPGDFSQRGGLIEVFPINLNQALRIEFFGNRIEIIERLDIKVKDRDAARDILKKKLKSQRLFSDLKGLKPGDYLVHLDHGIGIYSQKISINSENVSLTAGYGVSNQQYYVLEYTQGDKLYVPVGLERKLSRYVGFIEPKISRLSSSIWQRAKKEIKEGAEKLAKELLEIYAKREISIRNPYLPADEIDSQIALTFQHNETPDQIQAIEEVIKDLESEKPMDRLICGDVGFGKTEVALRAMVKAVKSGYRAAMICPTTILSSQHFNNFKERLNNLPIRIDVLSRFQSKKEQKKIIDRLHRDQIDILIGTHRILSNDVAPFLFKENGAGLLVIDDEQRFGVKQKEKLKKLRASLDILSLSATPIPRTLYLSLSSLKNISLIQTPPVGRLPVKTFILPFQNKIIKEAIKNEISRKGQVYYLHNRIETIEAVRKLLDNLLPGTKISVVHGRLKEKDIIKAMTDFQNRKTDVLIATTIIENGLDLPNVNTLIVADATKLGLTQAYQLRGRIGRSHLQAFAYFLYGGHLSDLAKERLNALKEAEALGSGYKIALKDLEIRGAGNILGKEQSGNINKVGLNLYCQILSDEIEKIKSSAQTNGVAKVL
jgi:transcription-repair coupling factor (superfamily II helicase)